LSAFGVANGPHDVLYQLNLVNSYTAL